MIFAPLAMTYTFAAFTAESAPVYMPGAPFLLSVVLIAIALFVFARSGHVDAHEK
jgi:DHA1 family tetracycline resistance protein-like MFS transporter